MIEKESNALPASSLLRRIDDANHIMGRCEDSDEEEVSPLEPIPAIKRANKVVTSYRGHLVQG